MAKASDGSLNTSKQRCLIREETVKERKTVLLLSITSVLSNHFFMH